MPKSGFIGCEPYVNGMAKILSAIEAHNIGNIKLFAGDAAELLVQFVEEFRRFRQRLHRVERIEQAALRGRAGHELRDALRALGAHRVGIEQAFLPDETGEEAFG